MVVPCPGHFPPFRRDPLRERSAERSLNGSRRNEDYSRPMTATAYIALGSNLGDRRDYLDRALQLLREQPGITVTKVSSYRETEPVGGPSGQGKYLNAAAELQTDLEPEALLRVLL